MTGKKNDASTHGRWYVVSRIYGAEDEHETVYMTRVWLGRLRLHIFYRGDSDPDCHDHPWDFWTFPLTPYVEEVLAPKLAKHIRDMTENYKASAICPPNGLVRYRQIVPAFRITFRPGSHAHRVLGRASDIARHWSAGERIPSPVSTEKLIDPRPIVTIVWRSKPRNGARNWGFFKNTGNKWCFNHFVKYIREGGKNAPCE